MFHRGDAQRGKVWRAAAQGGRGRAARLQGASARGKKLLLNVAPWMGEGEGDELLLARRGRRPWREERGAALSCCRTPRRRGERHGRLRARTREGAAPMEERSSAAGLLAHHGEEQRRSGPRGELGRRRAPKELLLLRARSREGGRWGTGGLLLEEEEEGQGAPRHCWPRGGRALLLGASQRWKKGSAAMGGREFLRAEQRKELCVRERGRRESGG